MTRESKSRRSEPEKDEHVCNQTLDAELDGVLQIPVVRREWIETESYGRLVSCSQPRPPGSCEKCVESFAPVLDVRCAAACLPGKRVPHESRQSGYQHEPDDERHEADCQYTYRPFRATQQQNEEQNLQRTNNQCHAGYAQEKSQPDDGVCDPCREIAPLHGAKKPYCRRWHEYQERDSERLARKKYRSSPLDVDAPDLSPVVHGQTIVIARSESAHVEEVLEVRRHPEEHEHVGSHQDPFNDSDCAD